ncbi:MAG: hypothetical protein ACLQVJ_10120 [Syntrophobacteraceae bacterium]
MQDEIQKKYPPFKAEALRQHFKADGPGTIYIGKDLLKGFNVCVNIGDDGYFHKSRKATP